LYKRSFAAISKGFTALPAMGRQSGSYYRHNENYNTDLINFLHLVRIPFSSAINFPLKRGCDSLFF
jgi:hypothetical protein